MELAAFRGKAMAAAAAGVPCGMTAVLGLDREKLRQACAEASDEGVVEIANYNCPGQLVIGGHKAAVDKARRQGQGAGRQALPAPEGQRAFPHLAAGPRRRRPAGKVHRAPFR